jgi:WD40 repeat protein
LQTVRRSLERLGELRRRMTVAQQSLLGSLLVLAVIFWLTSNPGTPWQSATGLVFSRDGRQLAIGVYAGRFRRQRSRWYFGELEHTAALADLGASRPPTIFGHEFRGGNQNMMPEVFLGPSVALCKDDSLLASAGFEGQFRLYDVATGRLKETRDMDKPHVHTLLAVPRHDQLLTAFRHWLMIWDLDDARSSLMETGGNIQAVAVTPDGTRLALGGVRSLEIEFRDLATHKVLGRITPPEDSGEGIRALAFTPDGKTLVAAGDQSIQIIDAEARKVTGSIFERLVLALALSPDGRYLATGRYDGLTIWDWHTKQPILPRRTLPAVESVAFSPDSRRVAAGSTDGAIHVWNLETGDLEWSWQVTASRAPEIVARIKLVLLAAWLAALGAYVGARFWHRRALRRDTASMSV